MKIVTLSSVIVLLYNYGTALNLPGPEVYVVTPSSKPRIDEGRSAPKPFYYHSWMKRMDSIQDVTTTTTTAAPRLKTPDLIFAEFESDNMKNIRKLLEEEQIRKTTTTTTTTAKPIYVSDDYKGYQKSYGLPTTDKEEVKNEDRTDDKTDYFAMYNNLYNNNNVVPVYQPSSATSSQTPKPTTTTSNVVENKNDKTDYFALYNNLYNNDSAPFAPVYQPSSTFSTTKLTTTAITPTPVNNVENIWHIIDSEKLDQYSGQWNEVPIDTTVSNSDEQDKKINEKHGEEQKSHKENGQGADVNDYNNFSLPGFGTEPAMGGENESRAIRTEPNVRFPYVNLKPFQLKNMRKPLADMFSNSKKGNNNMFTNLDNFVEVKHPVRGEVQDDPMQRPLANVPIDRYNPAQPYLPGPSDYGTKSKQASPVSSPTKTYSNLVPPPPPPPPKVTDNNFPAPSTYESFPPFASPGFDSAPSAPLSPPKAPMPPIYQQPVQSADFNSNTGDDGPPDMSYQYKPPSSPSQNFLPTLPPLKKPFGGYSYDKPPMAAEAPPADMNDTPDFKGYSYDKPTPMPEKPAFHAYHYDKPEAPSPPQDHGHSYDHHGPTHPDYPELIYDKPHGGMDDSKGGDDTNADDMGMVPPPMPDMKPGSHLHGPSVEDSGFPHDFPGDFKYHHDFDDHDLYHHHHHHPTTTTTTETPRVNRYSYYYLGKKLYYLPLYFSVYFIVYVAALIIKAVLRHKIVYPNSWRPNDQTSTFFSKRSIDSMDFSTENLHEITGRVTHAIATAAERYMKEKSE